MFFVFSKILYFLTTPLSWIIGCLILAYVFRKNIKRLKLWTFLALALILIFSNTALYTYFANKWEVAPIAPRNFKNNYEYAIVLGGMASINPHTNKLYFGTAIDRILTAISLYNNHQVKKIVITGGSGLLLNNEKKEAPYLEDFCIEMGVNKDDIILESESRNTYENALFTKKKIGIPQEKVLLITSASHMRRSIGCFKKQGFKFDYLAADPSGKPEIFLDDYIVPKADALMKWNLLTKEWIGYVAYKLNGYI